MKLVIDRKTWLRGDPASYLLREQDGKMCCLGFLSLQCGVTKEKMMGLATVAVGADANAEFRQGALASLAQVNKYARDPDAPYKNTDIADALMEANDDTLLSDAQREESLVELFKKIGVDVEFEG
jgi:hypothetical protein